jgi:WD40 repeat protein
MNVSAGNNLLVINVTLQTQLTSLSPGHTNGPVSGMKSLNDGRLATVAKDGVIKIWNATSNSLINTITGLGQSGSLYLESLGNGLLATAGHEGTVKAWNVSSSSTAISAGTVTIPGNNAIVCLKRIDNGLLVAADDSQNLCAWNMSNLLQAFYIANSHGNNIKSLEALANNTFASCDADGFVKIWNSTGSLVNSFQPFGNIASNYLLRLPGGHLAMAASGFLGIWFIQSLAVFTKTYNLYLNSSMKSPNTLLVYENTTLIAGFGKVGGDLYLYNITANYTKSGNLKVGDVVKVLEQAYPGI